MGTYNNSESNMKKYKYKTFLALVIIVLGASVFLSLVILKESSRIISDKVTTLVAANNMQLKLNINSYLSKLETTGTLIFSDKKHYNYNPSDLTMEKYDKIVREKEIEDRIVELGLIENYADFGIVYANNHYVGWVSNNTVELFGADSLFTVLTSNLKRHRTQDGWFTGINNDYDRIYYVKRLNGSAVLVTSLYSNELEKVFEYPEELSDMTIRLIDDSNHIIYSSDQSEIGDILPQDIYNLIGEETSASVFNDDYLATVNKCENGWRVVCSIPTDIILQENKYLATFTYIIGIIVAIVCITAGIILISKITNPVSGIMDDLQMQANIDKLSGLLNKITFEETTTQILTNK